MTDAQGRYLHEVRIEIVSALKRMLAWGVVIGVSLMMGATVAAWCLN